ncbi:carbamoyltransferase HypF [Alteromonas facilis]|uniref:carbamoyltransferase HypF n=1 Tax=Alteromonas facilis TaxID=2048004 RepID=UPI000C2910D7|nr:carbamoyltransferase HypF [Alteromonas facilis]
MVRLRFNGRVQGVGFRPCVKRVADHLGLTGRVWNAEQGVIVELHASDRATQAFIDVLNTALPEVARIDSTQIEYDIEGFEHSSFDIVQSDDNWHGKNVLPDIALCSDCRLDIETPTGRFHQYPFTICANCGPRFSMICTMPFDRGHTSMEQFPMCTACSNEFADPAARRFHIEGLSCQSCGPTLTFYDRSGCEFVTQHDNIMVEAADRISRGDIIAIKGLGGFHIACSALKPDTISRLRSRKKRPTKPLAIMMKDIAQVEQYFTLTELQRSLLQAAEAPIVLLPKKQSIQPLPDVIAPGVNEIGIMLAYSPLHFLLLQATNEPLVMTSGNPRGEPICIDIDQAIEQLSGMVDGWLSHNRNIVHRVDDSLVRCCNSRSLLIRRARGYVPEPISMPLYKKSEQSHILALGADFKNTFAITLGGDVILSGHNGDLADVGNFIDLQSQIESMKLLYGVCIDTVVIDKHPDYFSANLGRQLAEQYSLRLVQVQHHHAHFAACLCDNQVKVTAPILGIMLDGIGYGDDGTLWGAEILLGDYSECSKIGGLASFPLLGGDAANRQPWRNMIALLVNAGVWEDFLKSPLTRERIPPSLDKEHLSLLLNRFEQFPQTSSAGRLFDAVASLLCVTPMEQSYEGEAAMKLEALAEQMSDIGNKVSLVCFSIIEKEGKWRLDPSVFFKALLKHLTEGHYTSAELALWFHLCFVESWARVVEKVSAQKRYVGSEVALSGGVFQNMLILNGLTERLEKAGFKVYSHLHVPTNDAGIALGQCVIAANRE